MATVTLLKKLLHSIPLGRKADPDLKAAVAADDLPLFRMRFWLYLQSQRSDFASNLGQSPLLAAWSIDAVDLSGRERELAASLEELTSHKKKKAKTRGKDKEKNSRESREI